MKTVTTGEHAQTSKTTRAMLIAIVATVTLTTSANAIVPVVVPIAVGANIARVAVISGAKYVFRSEAVRSAFIIIGMTSAAEAASNARRDYEDEKYRKELNGW